MTAPHGSAIRARGYATRLQHAAVPRVRAGAQWAKKVGNKVDSREVRMARRAVTAVRGRAIPYLYLGDSLLTFVSPLDADRRKLVEMVTDGLGGSRAATSAHGSSYHSDLYSQYVRLVTARGNRPVVILPLCVRTHLDPWFHHPKLSYRPAVEFLDALPADAPPRAIHAAIKDPSPEQFEAQYRMPFPTVAGDLLVGDYVRPLRNPVVAGLDADEQLRLLYAYHHGGRVRPDGAALASVVRLAQQLRASGCPTVVYETPVPVERGSSLWGARMFDVARENLDLLGDAFRTGWGADFEILATGTRLGSDAFIDPDDGSEHLNETGRAWVANQLVQAALRARQTVD